MNRRKINSSIIPFEDVEDDSDQAYTPWIDYCIKYPCCMHEKSERKLSPNDNGFWCCPICGASYGQK